MLVNISLVVALCSGLSMTQIQTKMHALESSNPGAKVSLRLDKKAECNGSEIIRKGKKKSL